LEQLWKDIMSRKTSKLWIKPQTPLWALRAEVWEHSARIGGSPNLYDEHHLDL
jgi:hypothetical protein